MPQVVHAPTLPSPVPRTKYGAPTPWPGEVPRRIIGLDPGWRSPCAAVLLARLRDGTFHVRWSVARTQTPVLEVLDELSAASHIPRPVIATEHAVVHRRPPHGASVRDALEARGWAVHPLRYRVRDRMAALRGALSAPPGSPRLTFCEDPGPVADAVRAYSGGQDPNGRWVHRTPDHAHLIDALSYAVAFALRRSNFGPAGGHHPRTA